MHPMYAKNRQTVWNSPAPEVTITGKKKKKKIIPSEPTFQSDIQDVITFPQNV